MLTSIDAKKNFDVYKINKIINPAQTKDCFYYYLLFHKELTENSNLQNSEKEIIKLLSIVCSFVFSKESGTYDSLWYINGNRSFNAKDLTEIDLSFLESIVEKISDEELRSRIADILWIKKKHHLYAKIAIESFIKIGRHFLEITSDKVPEVNQFFERFERSIQITLSIKDKIQIEKIAKELKDFLEKTPHPFKNDYSIECLLKLIELTGCEYVFCLSFIENNFDKLTDTHCRDRICDIAIKVAKKLKHQEKVNNFYRYKAKNLYKESNRFAMEGEVSSNSYIGASHWLKQALRDLKKINPKSTEDLILENGWETLLTEFNKKMFEGLEPVSIEFDATPLIEENNRRLAELKKYNSDVIMTLHLFTKDHLHKEEYFSQETEKTLSDCVGKIILGNGAKEILNSDSQKEKAVQKFNHFYLSLRVFEIENLRNYIIQSFKKNEINQAISFFINDNPLVPKQKLKQIFQAIWSGFFEECIVSSYIIPAQIESMLRIRLDDIYSLKTDKENLTQQDRLLGEILGDPKYRKYLEDDELLGKNFIFHIEALLNHKHGTNLRNEVYHGYWDDDFFKGPSNIYLWWLFLKIIVNAKIKSAL